MIEFYDSLAGKKIDSRAVNEFLFDGLFAMKIIAELDGYGNNPNLQVKLDEYKCYGMGPDKICEIVDELYANYIKSDLLAH